jgi:hypothetical protein
LQKWLQFSHQFLRQTFWFFINAGADVESFRFKNQFSVLIQNAMAEIHADFFKRRHPDFHRQQIIVARGKFVAQPRLDDGKNKIALLQSQNRLPERAEKFAARGLEQVKIARMINVVADGAFGVSDAVRMMKWFGHDARVKR